MKMPNIKSGAFCVLIKIVYPLLPIFETIV